MNYGGNMPDWHQYNSTQPIGSEVPPVSQNANHSPIFGPNISPRRLNGPTFSPEGLNKHQNDNFNPRTFQQSPNKLNGPNVPPENSSMGSTAQMSGCHGPYGAPSPRNTMIEGTNTSLDSRNIPSSSLNESIGQRNHQISMSRPAAHLNCSTINGSMGPMGQRNTPASLQGPIPASSRQGPSSYVPCKLPCCNPDSNISYQSWEKYGPYPPNVPYRDAGYPVDNRRFGNDFENREQLGPGPYSIDPRRNFPDYKYRKDSIIPRTYTHPTGVIQNYPIQNYNFSADYQKYPAYPIKEYPRESSITNPQNPALLKYQEQSVIVQQKYFTKQIQYQNGVIPKNIVPNNIGGSVISRAQNPYFNPQLARDFPCSYSDSTPLANRGLQTTNSIHSTYPKYQMYQQKIAMQRFSMENHLRDLTRIVGYQSHPKYQESVLRYRELLRLQQTVDYQSTVQDQPKVRSTSQVNEEIPPINLQFDQHGALINSNFVPAGFSNLQSPVNIQNSKNLQGVTNTELGPLNLQHSEHFKTQASEVGPLNLQHSEQFKSQESEVGPLNLQHSQQFKTQVNEVGPLNLQHSQQFKTQTSIDNHVLDQDSSSLSQSELSNTNERHYSTEENQLHMEKYESERRNIPNSDDSKNSSMHQRNSRDFADKPELDVRQFLANWDESEDEDGTNTNLPDVVLSNSTSGVVEYENTKLVPDNLGESENCSETEDCCGGEDCEMFENTKNETKPSNSEDGQIYECDLPLGGESTKSIKQDSDSSNSEKKIIRTGTVIQPTGTECKNEMTSHIMENLANGQAAQGTAKVLDQERESLNNNGSQESTDTIKDDIIVKTESSMEKETITSLKDHINQQASTKICSSIEEIIENNDGSRSSCGKESSEDTKHHFDSDEDLSESGDSDSVDTHSISSYIKSPKTIKGTEIHVDAQELSAITVPSKSNSEMLDSTNLEKQNSFASEESHNPDDISLPDLPTSECTPISTTLNTPIHSDSEESSEPVIDLTTPANPIEIIQNSPMLSFTHSPIKMEPYEHLDENDLTDKVSHDNLDFEFQGSNSCDNDYEKLTDVSSNTTEQYNTAQNNEDSFDSDCVEILSEKLEPKIKVHTSGVETNNDVADKITDQNRFAFNDSNVMRTDKANTTVNADHQPWSSVTVRESKHQISSNTDDQDTKTDVDKLETLSEMKGRLSIISDVTKDHFKNDMMHVSSAKHYHSTNKCEIKCKMDNDRCELTDNMTALNLVKDENKIKSNAITVTDEIPNSEEDPKPSRNCPSNSDERTDFKHLNQNDCNSTMENEEIFTSTEHTVGYPSSSEEIKIYTERIENQSNFTGSLNIPLIPGEDFEEPKMPVLPMEGNCLTKIIKNTSPITDLDVLGSDDEKLDKMDEIWMEVGGVEAVDKVTDSNVESYTECTDGSDREKSLSSRNKPRKLPKYDWKCLKNSIKPKDPNKLFGKVYDNSQERSFKSTVEKNSQLLKPNSLEIARKELEPINKNSHSGTDNTEAILQEKDNFPTVPNISKVTSNSASCEDGKQIRDICFENNATEVLKCQEKANHINDIATKLLENARLFEPELRKIEVQIKESSCGEYNRDGSKKRIKLLKEFRKVKNKINIDRPGIESVKSQGDIENNAIPSIEIPEECKKVDIEIMEVDNNIIKTHNAFTGTIKNIQQKSDFMITNPTNTVDCQMIQKLNVNRKQNTLHAIPSDIAIPGEKLRQILNHGKATSRNDNTSRESCSIVNMEDNITVEDANSVNSHNSLNTKVVSPIEEHINECAINLSKSSNDFDLLQTLSEKGCVSNDSHNSYTVEHMKIEEPTEIESKTEKKTSFIETKDENPILSQTSCPEDSRLHSEIAEEDDKTLELRLDIELHNVTEASSENSSTSTCTNSAEESIWKENAKQGIDKESRRTADHKAAEKFIGNLEENEDLAKSCKHPEKIVDTIYENCKNSTKVCKINEDEVKTFVSKPSGYPESIELVAVDKTEDEKSANIIPDFKMTGNEENIWNNVGRRSTVNKNESIELIDSFDRSEKSPLPNHYPEEDIYIEKIDNALQNSNNISDEKVIQSVENCSDIISVTHQERNIGKLSVAQELMESKPVINNDCATSIQKTLQDLSVITDIRTESKIIHHDIEIIEKPSVANESLVQVQLEECSKTECFQMSNLELVSRIDKSSNTVDATLETFGLENSFNDFSNFDVAPNSSNTNTDQSNNWKYSKAYARFEDCERYKNPDNFVNPILPTLETLDNLNTVPVYTTKDGKITYSPNPKYTYRALIMEAREREGYSSLRKSYCGNPRAQESFNYSKNQASFRKRKNSDIYNYSGSYGKKNYFEYFERREYGESSMKNSPNPWNKSYFNQGKYNHQSRDRNSHHFTPLTSDAEKKHTSENISQEKVSTKHREGYIAFDEHNERKNGTSESLKCNNKIQYEQSREESTSDSIWSGSKQGQKCDQNSLEIALLKPKPFKHTNEMRTKNLEVTINTQKDINDSKNGNELKDFQHNAKFTSTSNEIKQTTETSTNAIQAKTELSISSDTLFVGKTFPDLKVDESDSSFSKTGKKPLNDWSLLDISNNAANDDLTIERGLFSSEWEDTCENSTVQQISSCEIKLPTIPFPDEITEVCGKTSESNELCNEVDDVHQNKTPDMNKKKSEGTDLSNNMFVTPPNLVKSPIRNERLEELDNNPEVLNTARDESTINDVENKDAPYSIPAELIETDIDADKRRITEIPETPIKSEFETSLNKVGEGTPDEDEFDKLLHCTDGQVSLNFTDNYISEVKDVDHEDVLKDEIHVDKQNELTSSIQISDARDNLSALKSNDQILHSSEELYKIPDNQEIERRELKIKSHKFKPENKNGTSINNLQQASNNSLFLKMISEYENISKPQSQIENYVAYSPSDETPEDTKAIPKLVIKKADTLSCKNLCLGTSSITSHDAFVEKVLDKEEHGPRASIHPKIPKILIRNVKSRPSTPSIEEITEKKIFSVSTKEDSKVPKVKIRFEDNRPRIPTVSSTENICKTDAMETKIPKIKIKLEDRLPKVIIEKIDTQSAGSNEKLQKTIPKMKIKKFKGALRQIVDTQILPVSIPRMFIYTELDTEKKTAIQVLTKQKVSTSDENMKSVTSNSIQEDQKTVNDADIKKIPKLKIKRQSSGCSTEMSRKRHCVSPIQSELKKIRKSSKFAESNDKKQFAKLPVGLEHQNSSKQLDNFSVKQSYELASSENVKHTTAAQSTESVRGELPKSTGGNISATPEEIPKVIIKRTSPSAQFKCELSKVRRDAIIQNKRWQPEVKLQRSWVLDCMAKDLNLDKLRLKLATPDSILKKCLPQKKPKIAESQVNNGNANTNQSEKKLFRSKSTSELVPVNGNIGILIKNDIEQLNETSGTELERELNTPKRCKSDLGGTFLKYSEDFESRKKLKHNNHSSTIQMMSKPTLNCVNDISNSSSIQLVEEADMEIEKYRGITDLKTTLNFNEIQSKNEAGHLMETSEICQDKTIDEDKNSKTKISQRKLNSLPLSNDTSDRSFVDLDLNPKISSGLTNTTNNSKSRSKSFENSNEITNILVNDLKIDRIHEVNDNHSNYSATKCEDRFEDSKDSVIVKNTNVDCVKRHTKSGKKHTKEIKNEDTKQAKNVEFENNSTSAIKNIYIDEQKSHNISSTTMTTHDQIDQVETLTKAPARSVIFQSPISMKPDINIPELNSEIWSSDNSNMLDNLETINCKNNIYELDINDNSDGRVKEADNNNVVGENSISYIDVEPQESTHMPNENVLITSVNYNSKSTDSNTKNVQDPKIFHNLNDRPDNIIHSDGNSAKKLESSDESQTIIEILSDPPGFSHSEVEIQLCPDVLEENGICLYHEDAIPTQFGLELEIIDNTVPDPLEVPIPENDHSFEEFRVYSGDELNEESHQSSGILNNSEDSLILDDSNSETTLREENNSQVCSISTYQREVLPYSDKQDTVLSVDIDKRISTSNAHMKTSIEFDSKVQKSFGCSDLLVKEVLAAKERLRKCLVETRTESRLKFKTRPKTAAEKKQGSSFDLNRIETAEESLTKLENHSSINFIAEANSSKQTVQKFSSVNNNEKLFHNKTKTELQLNKIKSETKHSKSSKNNLKRKKYSSLTTNIQKYTDLTQVEGHLVPKHSSINIEDRVKFTKGETTISLKNSKYLIKNHSYSDVRKKMPELINSKDSKCRSKSSRHDVNSKYFGKLKNAVPNTEVQESSLDSGQSEEKSVSDIAKYKYKSMKTSSDQNVNSMTDKPKFKLYKIPKIPKFTHPENERLTEELRESQSKEARMPILEPQIGLNGSLEVSELSRSDRETSRSPPVITSQESRADYEITARSSECQESLNTKNEDLPRQKTTLLEKEVPEAMPSSDKETTVADIVNDMAYHEKATIRHRRYCTLCERWFPTVAKYRRHLSGYQHRHTELTQRRTIHALFTLFTGRPCPRLQPPSIVRIDCEPGELTPLQIAVQGVTKESNKVDGNIKKPTRDDK